MQATLRSVLAVALLCTLHTVYAQETADTEERNTGPKNIVITYRCAPAKRPALRQYMASEGVHRFERWKQEGVFADYRILLNRYNDAETYDLMAVLNFKNYADVRKWSKIEADSPGGLTPAALSIITPMNTFSIDAISHGSAPSIPPRAKTVCCLSPSHHDPNTIEEYIK